MNKVFRHKLSKISTAIVLSLIKEFFYGLWLMPKGNKMSTGQLEKQQIFAINNFNYVLKQKILKEFLLKKKDDWINNKNEGNKKQKQWH